MPANPIPNVSAPLAGVLVDPVSGNFYGGTVGTAVASVLNIPNRQAPTQAIIVDPVTGLPA